jgi:hypothetical protein
VTAKKAGKIALSLQVEAARSDASPSLTVEAGYGHLVVEHYRRFPSDAALQAAGASVLASLVSDRKPTASSFGGTFAARALPFAVSAGVLAGDLVHVLGAATSRTPSGEMHGQGIFLGTALVSPWASKNGVAASPDIPLTVDAVDRPKAATTRAYTLSMHGVFGRGGDIVAGAGGLDAFVFRAARSTGARVPSAFLSREGAATSITANAPAAEVLSLGLGSLDAATPVRIAAHVVASPTPSYPAGVLCWLRVDVESGGKSATSPLVDQYVTPSMASVALAMRTVVATPAAGTATLRAKVGCSQGAASPALVLSPVVFAEPFVGASL